mmetsp:Transcript_28578/g.42653  ORF Transcript_28578/g.42653 Transcript_28578/m.42653 type:complete len:253 (-) Transcript_28578:668-1426(-)
MISTTATMSFSETPKLFTISLLVNPFPIKFMISFSSFKLSFLEDLGSSSTSVSRFCLHHVTSCGLLLVPVFLNNDDTIFSTLLMLQFMYSSPISLFVIPFSTRLITFCSSGVKYSSFISSKVTLGIVVCSAAAAAVSSIIGCKTLSLDVAFISSFISISSLYIDAKDGLTASLPSSNAEESDIVLSGLLFLCRRSDFISSISHFISFIGINESLLSADDSRRTSDPNETMTSLLSTPCRTDNNSSGSNGFVR